MEADILIVKDWTVSEESKLSGIKHLRAQYTKSLAETKLNFAKSITRLEQ